MCVQAPQKLQAKPQATRVCGLKLLLEAAGTASGMTWCACAQALQKLQAQRDAAAAKIDAFMSEWEELEQLLSE